MSAAHELILARIKDVEDYVDRELDELDELEETDRVLSFMNMIEARQRREGDDELSRRLDALEAAHARVTITNVFNGSGHDDPEDVLKWAIDIEHVVTFKYRDAEGASSYRVVSPYDLHETAGGFTSLLAYDHGREGLRHFRVERIEGAVSLTDAEDYRDPQ